MANKIMDHPINDAVVVKSINWTEYAPSKGPNSAPNSKELIQSAAAISFNSSFLSLENFFDSPKSINLTSARSSFFFIAFVNSMFSGFKSLWTRSF